MKFDRSLFIGKFSAEAEEHLQKLNDGVLRLERGDPDADPATAEGQALMADLLRAAHTMKGSARMMGFGEINRVAHKLEDLLLEVKEGRVTAGQAVCDLIFRALDTMDSCRQAVVDGPADAAEESAAGQATAREVDDVVALLESAVQGEIASLPTQSAAPGAPRQDPPALHPDATLSGLHRMGPQHPGGEPPPAHPPATPVGAHRDAPSPRPVAEERIRVSAPKLDKTIRLTGEVIAAQKRAEVRQEELRRIWRMARAHARLLRSHHDAGTASLADGVVDSGQALFDALDRLMKQNREDVAGLGRIVLELQQDTLGLRMLPVSTVFDTFPRAVRDMAREQGKALDLVVEGGETELDKQMIERLSDPLMHMLRNAVDHGLEPPDEREANGKPRRGTISLRAFPVGDSIIVQLEDDGRGIDLEAIRHKALQQGLADEESVRAMSRRELQSLIFLSGFSTSRAVTDLSGRGVGLDVVRRNVIDELKGDISVDSEPGRGTRFTLTLPLTLTTLRVLFVRLGAHVFGLPVTYVRETTRVRPGDLIHVVDQEAIRLRDQFVPVVRLADVLRLPADAEASQPAPARGAGASPWLYLVVAEVADERVAFVVDEVTDEDDALVKPLPLHLKRIGILAGATIAADGAIVPILHVPGLIRTVRFEAPAATTAAHSEPQHEEAPARLLVVDDSLNTREIEKSILEAAGYVVDLARDGVDAIEAIERGPRYDLLVVDVEMPRLDGLSLTAQLRRDERYAHVPIVIVSSRDREEDRRRGLEAGADAYIVKGTFDQEDLTATVASLLGRAEPGAAR